ncbi:MAG TPA: response regulator [Longimicrobiales bacterium]|nr:response regulator [Longimicrobiales bacterium]
MKPRVLVADDEPSTAEMLALILGFTGYDVVRAYDGAQALELAKSIKPDVLLLDVQMPLLYGSDVAKRIKSDPELADRVVVLISSADENDVQWREAGADAFLRKPIDIRVLPAVVHQLVTERRRTT